MSAPATDQPSSKIGPRARGVGRVLVIVYAILAIGATSRAAYQFFTPQFVLAPVPIVLSAVSGIIYILATIALMLPGSRWYRIAWVTISFELLGVVVVGTLSVLIPSIFADEASVWSYYGVGYVLIPLVLPVLGMVWLSRRRRASVGA